MSSYHLKIAIAAMLGTSAIGLSPAAADHRDYYEGDGYYDDSGYYDRGQPRYCDRNHDHRVHHRYYYDYYPADRYYGARRSHGHGHGHGHGYGHGRH